MKKSAFFISSYLELPSLPYIAPITVISDCQNISIILTCTKLTDGLVGGDLSLLKVYEEPLDYVEGSPLTLHNHFI